jgi:hypothetical protein
MEIAIAGHYTWIQPMITPRKSMPLHEVHAPLETHIFYIADDANRIGVCACL